MGVVKNVEIATFPKQSEHVGSRVRVYFAYDTTRTIEGAVVRDDYEEPWETILLLDDGRIVRGAECQFQLIGK